MYFLVWDSVYLYTPGPGPCLKGDVKIYIVFVSEQN